jgi:hypothetical protein
MFRFNILALVAGALLIFGSTAQAAGPKVKAQPWEFVGTAEQCGGTAGVDTVEATWISNQGLPDAGNSNHALYLQKDSPTANCAAAGATISGAEGIVLTELGFDYRNDSYCGAGAPRFNVYTTAGTYFFFGCADGAHTPAPDDPTNWTRVRFGDADAVPADGTTAFPGFGSVVVTGIDIVFDEGPGSALIDNIDINSTLIGKPGNA